MYEITPGSRKAKIYYFITAMITLLWIAVMVMIFNFSSKPADLSTQQSHAVDEIICRVVIRNFKDLTEYLRDHYIELIDKFVRKSAHFCEFMLLGFVTFNEIKWSSYGLILPRIKEKFSEEYLNSRRKLIFLIYILSSCVWCFLYACTDEIHQYYVSGRYSSFTDVLIDLAGAFVGIMIAFLSTLKKPKNRTV